jgi:hypothetical protein
MFASLPVELSDALLSVLAVGGSVFAIYLGMKLYKWIAYTL